MYRMKAKNIRQRRENRRVSLRAQLFGSFRVWRWDEERARWTLIRSWPTRKIQTLCKILLLHRGRTLKSEQLIEWLWPEAPERRGRNRLWQAICVLRRLLEPHRRQRAAFRLIQTTFEGYQLRADRVQVDVDCFLAWKELGEQLHARGEFEQAICAYQEAKRLYQGDLLEDDRYEDWVLAPREHLQEAYYQLLCELADCHLERREFKKALQNYEQILSFNPCRETIWQRVMLCQAFLGDRDQVLHTFRRCRDVLQATLGVEPLPQTEELCG